MKRIVFILLTALMVSTCQAAASLYYDEQTSEIVIISDSADSWEGYIEAGPCAYGELGTPYDVQGCCGGIIIFPLPPEPCFPGCTPCDGGGQICVIGCLDLNPDDGCPVAGEQWRIPLDYYGVCPEETYTVDLIADDWATILDSVTIDPPITVDIEAAAGGSYQIGSGETITLDGSGSLIDEDDEVELEWTIDGESVGQGQEVMVSYSYLRNDLSLEPGVYDVELTITGLCDVDSDTTTIDIAEATGPSMNYNETTCELEVIGIIPMEGYIINGYSCINLGEPIVDECSWAECTIIEEWQFCTVGCDDVNPECEAGTSAMLRFPVEYDGTCPGESITINLYADDLVFILASETFYPSITEFVAEAGGPYQIGAGETITLNGSGPLMDPCNEVTLEWTIDGEPTGQGSEVTVSYYDLRDDLSLEPGVYDVELTATGVCDVDSDISSIKIAEEPNLSLVYNGGTGNIEVHCANAVPYHALLGVYDTGEGDIGPVTPEPAAGNNAGTGENFDGPGYLGYDHLVDIHASELYPFDTITSGLHFTAPVYPAGGGNIVISIVAVNVIDPPLGDMDGDDDVDLADFAALSAHWLESDCSENNDWCDSADIDRINDVDIGDIYLLSYYWLTGAQ
ncbi:MAG: hypothetical protein JW860_09645 [Sedimentisphaerales bacterium]|nr:hypothetical protein [Sedimentisphaerales bacterium]